MFRTLSITNFRGFKQLKVDGMERINLFVGMNNVGKSALLESVFLLAAPMNAELSLRLSAFRGLDQFQASEIEDVWGWLFYGKDAKQQIALDLATENLKHRSLKMKITERKVTRTNQGKKKGPASVGRSRSLQTTSKSAVPMELLLDYKTETGASGEARAYFHEGGVAFEHGKLSSFPSSVFVTARIGYAPENAQRYSKLQESMKEDEIIPSLQLLEPRLTRLTLLATGFGSMLHGDIGIGRLVPLPMMGEGIGRLLTLLLAISEAKGGLVMIDEIDTGLHYSILSKVWSAVAKRAREAEVQVFATTHSWECLKAAHDSFSSSSIYDLRVHRLDRRDEEVKSTTYDMEMTEAALLSGLEMR